MLHRRRSIKICGPNIILRRSHWLSKHDNAMQITQAEQYSCLDIDRLDLVILNVTTHIVWPEPRTREEYARHSLSAAHQHKVMSVPTVESFRAAIGLFSHKRTHRGSADFTINTSWPTRGMSWSSSYWMDERTAKRYNTWGLKGQLLLPPKFLLYLFKRLT